MVNKDSGLGRALIKNQHKSHWSGELSQRHVEDISNAQSITENTSLDDFLAKTELANKQFEIQSENLSIVTPLKIPPSKAESRKEIENELIIPRRPNLKEAHDAETLKRLENENYLKWRRKLAALQEDENIILTPFEKNIEYWRQLWRVVERSDILVQILDARNPLMFYCEDLEKYCQELDEEYGKRRSIIILLNKSDYLTAEQRKHWHDYFISRGKNCVFFSALEQQAKINKQIQSSSNNDEDEDENDINLSGDLADLNINNDNNDYSKPLGYNELISYFKSLGTKEEIQFPLTIGFIGYPNVGKSSTLNALLRSKRVSVSATPGKTKHFQTIVLDEEIIFCDCPGLVFPNIVSSKAEMIINGILPIDQVKDVMMAIGSITSKVPAHIFESLYGIILNKPQDLQQPSDSEHQDSNNWKVSPLELLTVYGYSRGFMTQRGLPDTSKSAKYILKDFVTGKILYCYPPPNVEQESYHKFVKKQTNTTCEKEITDKKLIRIIESNNLIIKKDRIDQEFFDKKVYKAHIKDSKSIQTSSGSDGIKPWKKHKEKRNKKEKLRRVYAHLDN